MRKLISLPTAHLFLGIMSFLIGFALILGGPVRASATAYTIINGQGGPYVWGTVFVVIGVALMLSTDLPPLRGRLMLAGGIAYAVLATAFMWAAIWHADANLTAPIAYGGYAAIHFSAFHSLKHPRPPMPPPVLNL